MKHSRYRRPEPAQIEKRKAPRHRVAVVRAEVERNKQVPISALLRDISVYGCCLKLDAVLRVDEAVSLSFGENEGIDASIVWQKGGRVGCRFVNPISRQLFRSMTLAI